MTKAEKIFKDTRFACMEHIENFGYRTQENNDKAIGYNSMITEQAVSTRTANAITKILERKRKDIEIDIKLEILTEKEAEKEQQILNMIEATLNNVKRNIENFKQELKNL